MGSIAAARRTDSSSATFLASTNPSNLSVVPAPANPTNNYSPAMTTLLAHLPNVKHVEEASIQSIWPLGPNGLPQLSAVADKNITLLASINGLGFTQDRAVVTEGRMADASNPHRDSHDRRGRNFARCAPRLENGAGLLYARAVEQSSDHRVPDGQTPLHRRRPGRWSRPTEQRGRPGRHRPVPNLRVVHPGAHRELLSPPLLGTEDGPSTDSNSTTAMRMLQPSSVR